jgi:hypothetical protein
MESKRKPLTVEHLSRVILGLVEAGNSLVDGASKCGHDEEVEAWGKARNAAARTFSPEELLRIKAERQVEEEKKKRKAEEAFLERKRVEELRTIKSFDLSEDEMKFLIGM